MIDKQQPAPEWAKRISLKCACDIASDIAAQMNDETYDETSGFPPVTCATVREQIIESAILEARKVTRLECAKAACKMCRDGWPLKFEYGEWYHIGMACAASAIWRLE